MTPAQPKPARCPARQAVTNIRCARPSHDDADHDYDYFTREDSLIQTWTPPSRRGRA